MKTNRVRCAVCERTMGEGEGEAETLHRIVGQRMPRAFFLCGDCLALPSEDHIMDIARGMR